MTRLAIIFCYMISIFSCQENKFIPESKFYKDGAIKESFFRNKNGELEGEYKQFYPSGKLLTSKNFKDGKEYGRASHYYESGELKEVQYFDKGVLINGDTVYYQNGKIKFASYYDNGRKSGRFQRWSQQDSLEFETVYLNDTIVSIHDYIKQINTIK